MMLSILVAAAMESSWTRTEDVIYGRKAGTALTLDVFTPKEKPNGAGVFVLVSSGWGSSHSAINVKYVEHFTKRGFTVFALVHSSAPKFGIPEIIPDVCRAVRFVRFNAAKFGVKPLKLGATGVSSGAHLSLVMGTRSPDGDPKAKDPIDRVSSQVNAVGCFFPPTDFNNFVRPGINALDESVLKNYRKAIGEIPEDIEQRDALGRSISPIYQIEKKMAPTLIFHGDKDPYVLLHQSKSFVEKAKEKGAIAELVVKKGESHGWAKIAEDIELCADWFDRYLLDKPAK